MIYEDGLERGCLKCGQSCSQCTVASLYCSQSVVLATSSARKSTIRFWLGIGFAILFFGGFMARSYYEEYSFKRDVKRLLAYYEHIVPGTISDGDEQNARYLVWKYRSKKERLWKILEKKYGEPVLYANEWPDDVVRDKTTSEEEAVDLDAAEESFTEGGESDAEESASGGDESDEL
jgi:hypothetical protein